jgi:Spy/CpxP family protein refolding chaperone
MIRFSSAVVLSTLAFISTASATQPGSYVGQEQRDIKALSPEDVQSYLTGKGAGLAKAAELNHYPGPLHVLELADKLHLSEAQKARTKAIFDAMQKEAIRQGKALVETEQELDRQFATGAVTAGSLRSTLKQIGDLQADVRRSHLQAHIEQRAILTMAQIAKYDELRGYTSRAASGHDDHSHKH